MDRRTPWMNYELILWRVDGCAPEYYGYGMSVEKIQWVFEKGDDRDMAYISLRGLLPLAIRALDIPVYGARFELVRKQTGQREAYQDSFCVLRTGPAQIEDMQIPDLYSLNSNNNSAVELVIVLYAEVDRKWIVDNFLELG